MPRSNARLESTSCVSTPRVPIVVAPTAVAPIVVAAVAVALLWARLGPARRIAWAEDSGVFLQERLMFGPARVLWHPYDGYLHLVPRMLVDAAAALAPIGLYAVIIAGLSVLCTGAICALVFVLSADVVRTRWARVALALVPVLGPLVPYEIAGNVANLHWFLLWAAPWVFLARPTTWVRAGLLGLVAFLVCSSEVQAVLFAPLLLDVALMLVVPLALVVPLMPGRAVRRRRLRAFAPAAARLRRWPIAAGAALGIGAQAAAFISHPRPSVSGARPGLADILVGFLAQPLPAALTDQVGRTAAWSFRYAWLPTAGLLLVLVALAVIAAVRSESRARWALVATAGGAVGVWAAALLVNPDARMLWASHDAATILAIGPFRYAAASAMFIGAAMVVAGDALWQMRGDGARWPASQWARARWLGVRRGSLSRMLPIVGAVLAAVPLVVGGATLSAGETRRTGGPVWADEIAAGRARCEAQQDGATQRDGSAQRDGAAQREGSARLDGSVEVRAMPGLPRWSASIPCSVLLASDHPDDETAGGRGRAPTDPTR